MIRRYGRSPLNGTVYQARPGAYAILPRAGHLLLTFQADPHFEFQLPGGGIDPGESPLQALHREVLEETGWRIAAPRRVGTFRRFVYMPEYGIHAEKICHIFLARPALRLGPPREPGHTAHWVAATDAPDMVANSGDAAMVAQIVRGQ